MRLIKLLDRLRDGDATAGELREALGASQQNISNHLAILRDTGMGERTRTGNQVRYTISDPSAFELCEQVCGGVRCQLEQLEAILGQTADSSEGLAVPARSASGRAVLDDADRLVSEPVVETSSEQVIRVEHDERAASSARFGLGAGDERVREPPVAEPLFDPHRLQFATPAPDDGGDTRQDATVLLPSEDPELLLLAKSGSRDCRRRDAFLE
jgi:hypothetical protein